MSECINMLTMEPVIVQRGRDIPAASYHPRFFWEHSLRKVDRKKGEVVWMG